jgi:dTDP-4-dehydrorhamnose 3,5-epimerase
MKVEVVASRWDTEAAKILAMAQRLDRYTPFVLTRRWPTRSAHRHPSSGKHSKVDFDLSSYLPQMPIRVKHAAIRDVKLIEPSILSDKRGVSFVSFDQEEFEEHVARGYQFVQEHHTVSAHNVLCGLHYQIQRPQGKLVRVLNGEVVDVAVDLRRWSPTFGRWISARLSASNCRQLWIPPGFAHGSLVLSDVAEVLCKTTERRFVEHERTLRWDDPDIAIAWELDKAPITSALDATGTSFSMAEVY